MRLSHVETFGIKPGSDMYGTFNPSRRVACVDRWKHISDRADIFPEQTRRVMPKRKKQLADTRMDKTQRHTYRMHALAQMDDSIQCTSDAHLLVNMTDATRPAITYPGSDLILAARRTKPLPKAATKQRA